MRVYAKCIYGQDEAARRRIEAALTADQAAADQPTADQQSADQVTADTPTRDDGSEPGTPTGIRHDQSAGAGLDGSETDDNGPRPACPLVRGRLPELWRVEGSNLRSSRDRFTVCSL